MKNQKMTLASMCDGGVQERIDRALMKISDNILDPNTEAKKKRTLTLTITFIPDEDDREDVSLEVQTNMKLAPEIGLKTQLFINKDLANGMVSLTEHAKGQIKGQLTLDDMGMSTDPVEETAVTAEELGCDPETGEVIEQNKIVDMRSAMNG